MWQANWMSLGMIVTLFACMVQRLASSKRPTIYASAASCGHMMVLPWKHKSYLSTSRAILWTSHEKGSFVMRSSVLFLNCQISWRPTVPGQYSLVFLTFPAWRNSFQGALPPMVGWSFLLTWSRWPSLHSYLGQLSGWQWQQRPSHILQPSCFLHLPLCLFQLLLLLSHGWGLPGWWWVMYLGGGLHPFSAKALLASLDQSTHLSPPHSSFLGVTYHMIIWDLKILHAIYRKMANGSISHNWEDFTTFFLIFSFRVPWLLKKGKAVMHFRKSVREGARGRGSWWREYR